MIVALDDTPDVVAVIPTLAGNFPRLRRCIDSLCESEFDQRLAIVLVWNDPRVERIDLGPITILEPGLNLGFPGGMNFARASLTAPRIWVVQDDMTVAPDCLRSLIDRQDQPDQPAIVSPVIVNEHGLVPAKSRAGTVESGGVITPGYPFEDLSPDAFDPDVQLDWVTLSGALVRCDAWDSVGGMDPAFYPLMHSDVDFGYRLTRNGMRVVLEPNAVIVHELNGSTPSLFVRFLYERNVERFKSKHQLPIWAESKDKSDSITEIASREASVMVVDFAQYAERYVDGTREMISALEESVAEHYQHFLNAQSQEQKSDAELKRCRKALDDAVLRNQQLLATRSMRATKPLRALGALARRKRQS